MDLGKRAKMRMPEEDRASCCWRSSAQRLTKAMAGPCMHAPVRIMLNKHVILHCVDSLMQSTRIQIGLGWAHTHLINSSNLCSIDHSPSTRFLVHIH